MFVLDTNVVSELRRPEKANAKVRAWSETMPLTDTYIAAITILEIELGALSIARKDTERGRILRVWINDFIIPRFDGRILPVDTLVAQRCAQLHIPDPRSERDALIAATALVHGMKIVTRNVADFKFMNVDIVNPWE